MPRILKLTKEEFVRRSVISHPDTAFDYSDTIINGSKGSATMVCQKGHKFSQFINIHMRGGECPYCNGCLMNTQTFKEKAIKVHPNVPYDYSEVEYTKSNKKVHITCPSGHRFIQAPNIHLSGGGCRECSNIAAGNRMRKTQEDFVAEGLAAHPVSFDYSKAVYISDNEKVELTCPNGHHMWQKAGHHIKGIGCSKCTPYGYDGSKAGSLYILKTDDITKIGITNRSVAVRLKDINNSSGKNFVVMDSYLFCNGQIPKQVESSLLKELRKTHVSVEEVFDGSTECFLNVDYNALVERLLILSDYEKKRIECH